MPSGRLEATLLLSDETGAIAKLRILPDANMILVMRSAAYPETSKAPIMPSDRGSHTLSNNLPILAVFYWLLSLCRCDHMGCRRKLGVPICRLSDRETIRYTS